MIIGYLPFVKRTYGIQTIIVCEVLRLVKDVYVVLVFAFYFFTFNNKLFTVEKVPFFICAISRSGTFVRLLAF